MRHPGADFFREIPRILSYNLVIALFLTAVTNYELRLNLVYTNCIGLGIFAGVRASCHWRGRLRPDWRDGALAIPFGFASGFVLGTWLNGMTLDYVLAVHGHAIVIAACTALLFGSIATYDFYGQARLREAEADAQAERLARLEQETLTARAELSRLQAQIEPHFLFNTLSNVVGLIDSNPAAARAMLFDLTTLLRTALARSRQGDVTLEEELELLRAYLGIMAIRMGKRLSWDIEADADVLPIRLPPLLVQPLVENAVRHGLEPCPEGGALTIRCRRLGSVLGIEVEDSGRGMVENGSQGTGLANVRQRLAGRYGNAAALVLASNATGGLTVRLELPCAS